MNFHQAAGRSIYEDVPAGIENWRGEDITAHLERRVLETLACVEAAECWKLLMNPATSPALAQRILTEVYLEIAMYQPEAIEAAIASIGQMPRDMPVSWLADMLHHQVEEFDHGEMAIRDFVSMRGAKNTRGPASHRQAPLPWPPCGATLRISVILFSISGPSIFSMA
jgi:hypothetical protein